ncbi:hypothetical protein [Burkholderia latens]|nr:hypothetical protein [Burkholderia latens]QTO46361.1 hypothetical protein J8I85_18115 [Burkholderia latens]
MKEEHQKVWERADEARRIMVDFKDWIRGEQRKRDDAAFKMFMEKILQPL